MIIHTHLGLGDAIDCNGMVRYLQEQEQKDVFVIAKAKYFSLVEYMYRDSTNIMVVPIPGVNEYTEVDQIKNRKNLPVLKVGHTPEVNRRIEAENKNCAVIFYEMMDIPYSVRYDKFYVERDPQAEGGAFYDLVYSQIGTEPYVFVHDEEARGMKIDDSHFNGLHVVRNNMNYNPFNFIEIFENATEIHCMESSLKSIIDSYKLEKPRLVFHDFRGTPLGDITNNEWEVVGYDKVIRDY